MNQERDLLRGVLGSYPTLLLDESLNIIEADGAAQLLGLTADMSLRPYLLEEEILWHEQCVSRAENTPFDPLEQPQNHALFSLFGVPGASLLSAEYSYSLRRTLVRAVLYPNRTEYSRHCELALRERAEAFQFMHNALSRCQAQLSGETPPKDRDTLQKQMAAAMLAIQCLGPGVPDDSELYAEQVSKAVSLERLLVFYAEHIFPSVGPEGCTLELCPSGPKEPVYLCAENFMLLLSALLCVLGSLSEDRKVSVSWGERGAHGVDAVLSFSVQNAALSRQFIQNVDLHTLAAALRTRRVMLALVEEIFSKNELDAIVRGNPLTNTVTLSLYIPGEPLEDAFSSNHQLDLMLQDQRAGAAGLFSLFDAEK